MSHKHQISTWQILLLVAVALLGLGFVTHQYVAVGNGDILINFENSEAQFVVESEIRTALMEVAQENANLATSREVDLQMLEEELMLFSFVKDAQASRDIKGNLVIDIQQDEPIARLISSRGKGAYISREQHLLPLSPRFTPRIIAITGAGADSLLSETFLRGYKGQRIYNLINYLNADPFLSKQIAQIDVNEWMGVKLYPQVGKQEIEFGKAVDFEEKFEKLQIFYKEIVPKRGWNKYKSVKLQYEGQIVCKK